MFILKVQNYKVMQCNLGDTKSSDMINSGLSVGGFLLLQGIKRQACNISRIDLKYGYIFDKLVFTYMNIIFTDF